MVCANTNAKASESAHQRARKRRAISLAAFYVTLATLCIAHWQLAGLPPHAVNDLSGTRVALLQMPELYKPIPCKHDSLAERSKAVARGAIPKGRGFEPHSCHLDHLPARGGWASSCWQPIQLADTL